MAFESFEQIVQVCQEKSVSFAEAVIGEDMKDRLVTREATLEKMRYIWNSMLEAGRSYDENRISTSGLVGGDGGRMSHYADSGHTLCGDRMSRVIAQALQMGESNACMKRIVAAPTAGACGVLPAVLIPLFEETRQDCTLSAPAAEASVLTEDDFVLSLFVAAGIGQVIATRASIAGASGGCQAEIGTASAMAAGALVALRGGSGEQIGHAVAMALKNLMGLICDPVAGLVEVPCVKRNVIGAVNAVSVADMAMAGITSRIPVDEVIDAMGEVGRRMPVEFRETALGGLAVTPTGQAITERIRKSK